MVLFYIYYKLNYYSDYEGYDRDSKGRYIIWYL